MKKLFILLVFALTSTPIQAGTASSDVDVLNRLSLGAKGELIGESKDIEYAKKLAQIALNPPLDSFLSMPEMHQMILVQASVESLRGNEYLDMVSMILNAVDQGHVSTRVGSLLFWPASTSVEGVLEVNYLDDRIIDVLPKMRSKYADDPSLAAFIDRLISGEAKQNHIDYYTDMGLTPAEVIIHSPSETKNILSPPSYSESELKEKSNESPKNANGNGLLIKIAVILLAVCGSWVALILYRK